jgi:hypothetical protein
VFDSFRAFLGFPENFQGNPKRRRKSERNVMVIVVKNVDELLKLIGSAIKEGV